MTLNQGEFTSVDLESAEHGDTVMYVGGEALSYQTATLLENGNWKLTGLIRGQYGGEATYHAKGTSIARCDEAFLKSGIRNSYVGHTIYFKLTSFNVFGGQEQSLAEVQAYSFMPKSVQILPPDVEVLNVEKMSSSIRRYWWKFTYPEPNDIAGFILKYTQGRELNWETGFPVQDGLITSQPYETQTVRPGVHAVMIKAVDSNGNESKNFAYCLLDMGDLLQENVLFDADFGANGFEKMTHTGTVLSDGYIHALNSTTIWHDKGRKMWHSPETKMWGASFKAYTASANFMAPASGQFWLSSDIKGPAVVLYRLALASAQWADDDTSAMWDFDTSSFWDDSPDLWKQWSDKLEVRAGAQIEIRIESKNSSLQETIIKGLHAYIDVPDRQEHFEDLSIPAEGLELPITTPFYETTSVHIDAIEDDDAVNVKILSKTPCRIALLNSSGKQVAGTADITWQGFVNETLEGT